MTNSTTAGSAMRRIIGSDMAKPASRILVINDESLELRELVKGLNAPAPSLDNPPGISLTRVRTAEKALAALERGRQLHARAPLSVLTPLQVMTTRLANKP